jgi:hypothetical protein
MPLFHRYLSGLHIERPADGNLMPDFRVASMGFRGRATHEKSPFGYQDKLHCQTIGIGFFEAINRGRKKDEDYNEYK